MSDDAQHSPFQCRCPVGVCEPECEPKCEPKCARRREWPREWAGGLFWTESGVAGWLGLDERGEMRRFFWNFFPSPKCPASQLPWKIDDCPETVGE